MDIDKLRSIIKSNLVSFRLEPGQIEEITEHLLRDVMEFFDERD